MYKINHRAKQTLLYSASVELFDFQMLLFFFLFTHLIYFLFVSSGKHEEKKDEHGFVSRTFTRKYT